MTTKPETKFWKRIKNNASKITWTRLEVVTPAGLPDLIGFFNDPKKAAKNADVVFSDKVVSLNDKVNKAKKIDDFKNYRITSSLMKVTRPQSIFLHCLPRGNEVSEEVFFGKQSRVWQQAINRVHVQKSILLYCFGKLR